MLQGLIEVPDIAASEGIADREPEIEAAGIITELLLIYFSNIPPTSPAKAIFVSSRGMAVFVASCNTLMEKAASCGGCFSDAALFSAVRRAAAACIMTMPGWLEL